MKHCCEQMNEFVHQTKGTFDSDDIIYYSDCFDEYGIVIHDGGCSYIAVQYCPWCGKELPPTKRNQWFDELEKLGIDDPVTAEIPPEFRSSEWWKQRGL